MHGKVCVVTGPTSGVGKEVARELAARGATVVLAARDREKAEATRDELLRTTKNDALHVVELDLARMASVRAASQEISDRFPALHLLVNNAGLHTARRRLTEDGHELTFQTNHLGHFLLTHLLLDRLKAGAPSRVVNVASEAHRFARGIDFDDITHSRWSGLLAYNESKLANILFTRALARRLEGTGVSVFAAHPGSVRTRWARGRDSGVFRFAAAIASPFLISPEEGARTPLYAATAPGLEAHSGAYFVKSRRADPSGAAQDEAAQERLWRLSAEMVGLSRT